MQVKKPIVLYLPASFIDVIADRLKGDPLLSKYSIEYFYYVVYHLTVRQMQQKKKDSFSLNLKKMKAESVSNIDSYIRLLVKWELLICDKGYEVGKRAKTYKLNDKYINAFASVSIAPSTKLFKKLVKHSRLERKHVSELRPDLYLMWQTFKQLDFDYPEAKKWISTQPEPKQYYYFTALQMLEDDRFRYFDRNKRNKRLDTNLTSLKSDLRQFVKGDFVSIDLANSQPYFFSQLLLSIVSIQQGNTSCSYLDNDVVIKWFGKQAFNSISKVPTNDTLYQKGELLKLEKSCVSGRFYDDLQDCYKSDSLNRKEVKDMMFTVLFSRNVQYVNGSRFVPYRKEKAMFSKCYPFVNEIAYLLKQNDHSKLAVYLQKLEAFVFIDTICPRLVDRGIVPLTIHDSVIIERKDKDKALEIIKEVFKTMFCNVPAFHVERLSKV